MGQTAGRTPTDVLGVEAFPPRRMAGIRLIPDVPCATAISLLPPEAVHHNGSPWPIGSRPLQLEAPEAGAGLLTSHLRRERDAGVLPIPRSASETLEVRHDAHGLGAGDHLASAWLRPRIAPDAVMMTGTAGALAGRVFRLPGGTMTSVRNRRWRVVERRVFKQAGGIVVGARPRGKARASTIRVARANIGHSCVRFLDPFPPGAHS